MSDRGPGGDSGADPAADPRGPESSWERRRRLAEVFGDVLPEDTSDDRDADAGRRGAEGEPANERWLRSQVPPHHG